MCWRYDELYFTLLSLHNIQIKCYKLHVFNDDDDDIKFHTLLDFLDKALFE